MSNPLKIIEFRGENLKRIKVVQINPVDNTVIISGENGQGKSSVLDAIWWAVDATATNIEEPIRRGEDKAKSFLDFGDFKVTRTATKKGIYLKVEPKELVTRYGGAQSVLDAFIGKLSFDPMEFLRYDQKKQRDMLLKMIGLDINLEKWSAARKELYDQRTEANRQVKEYETKIKGIPTEQISNDEFNDLPNKEINLQSAIKNLDDAKNIKYTYEQANQKIDEFDKQITAIMEEKSQLLAYVTKFRDSGLPDVEALEQILNNIQQINANVRIMQEYNSTLESLEYKQKHVKQFTDKLDEMEKDKQDAIKKASFPIPGLNFDEVGVTYNNVPISQISASEQLKVSMSIAMALNPNLRVIMIKEGSLLDQKNLELVKQMVKDRDYQLWIEKVDDTGKLGIVIEDGEVKTSNDVKALGKINDLGNSGIDLKKGNWFD
jgi:recombinational DNA repair ATPase RecF